MRKSNSIIEKYKLGGLFYPILAILAAFIAGSILILLISTKNPIDVYSVLIKSAFGSLKSWDSSLVKAIPFIFTGLSFAAAKRCGIVNLGADGQFMIGALGGALIGIRLNGLPIYLHLPLTLIAGFLFGAIFGMIVALLKIKFGASELITSIMLNYIAANIIGWALTGPMQEKSAVLVNPQTELIPPSASIGRLFPATKFTLHYGIFIAIIALIFFYILIWRSSVGYQLRVVGINPSAGEYAGINKNRMILLSMFIAGGFAGLGGCIEIIAVQGRLMNTSFSIQYGFTGIAVALVGNNTPLGILLSGIFFGGLQAGALRMQILTGISSSMSQVIQAFVILFFTGRDMFRIKKA